MISPSPVNVRAMDTGSDFEPCAATASTFLYSQGSSILCLHHDTLAIDRRFQRHQEQILLVSVDNVSERGAGRLVVSYDAGQTAIVWDLFTGDEIARFASYEQIRVAAWMRNGNVAFGNTQGNVILFEPSTSEHISARTIFDPITALAPASDCRSYAVGYMNGSILIAALQPSFTILHTLTTARAPSPIVTLAWHASSSKQKSDMLATQTSDGDLRVWSVAKPPTADTPKVIRVLKRSEDYQSGPNWLAWSKNGRIAQYSEGETWAWDVRTKHVTYEPIETLNGVRALASYGPTASLFTLGPNHTVQQYDLSPPALVANVQHLPILPPPTPPVDIVEQKQQQSITSGTTAPFVPLRQESESEEDNIPMSPIQRTTYEMNAIELARRNRSETSSPLSSPGRSRAGSMSSHSSSGFNPYRSNRSISSKGVSSGTTFSYGSSVMSSRESILTGPSPALPSSSSIASSQRSRTKGSRLRQEVLRSPDQTNAPADLFPYTRGRLSDVPYKQPQTLDQSNLTPDDLRRQMLSVVFGWDHDIEPLIHDELCRHAPGSPSAVLLSKWLGDVNVDMMVSMVGSNSMSSSDWMLLALSQIGGHASTKKVGQAFVQRLLEKGDVHASVTILLGLGDRNDAVEVYVSRNYFMEAILLTCLVFPSDWQRQSHLVRRWGEFVVENSQQQLAIRCFSCTGVEPSEPWTSPTAQKAATFARQAQNVPRILSPPLSPPSIKPSGPSRMTAKNSALKLITSFGAQGTEPFKFPGLKSDDRTPTNAPGVTPIAESAISPGGTPGGPLKPHSRTLNSALSAKTMTPGGWVRSRLPSIGETPIDVTPHPFAVPDALPTPVDSGSDKEKDHRLASHAQDRKASDGDQDEPVLLLSSARYEPGKETPKKSPVTAVPMTAVKVQHLPAPAQGTFTALKVESRSRNGSRDRKPDGLQIQWPPMESIITGEYMSSAGEASCVRSGHRRSNTLSSLQTATSLQERFVTRSDTQSPPLTGQSQKSAKSPGYGGRSIDQYISSLEEANYYSRRQRGDSRRRQESRERGLGSDADYTSRARSKHRQRDPSDDRGRTGYRYIKPAKRSPSSPVPMSPEDIQAYNVSTESLNDEKFYRVSSPELELKRDRSRSRPRKGGSKLRGESKPSEHARRTVRHESTERHVTARAGGRHGSKAGSKTVSRRQSPDARSEKSGRGRSKSKVEGSGLRSPTSPLPMSPQARYHQKSEEEDDGLRMLAVDRQRLRSQQRSGSRRPHERGTSARRDESPDRRRPRDRSPSRQARETDASTHREFGESSIDRIHQREYSEEQAIEQTMTGLHRTKSERTLKKEMAAKELEARRISLARRPLAPAIPHPAELTNGRPPVGGRSHTDLDEIPTTWGPTNFGQRSVTQNEGSFGFPEILKSNSGSNRPTAAFGLPATPRAMRHPRYMSSDANGYGEMPAVPAMLTYPAEEYYREQHFHAPQRSISAPIPEQRSPGYPAPLPAGLPLHPAFQHALPPSSRRRNLSPGNQRRRVTPGEAQPGTLGYGAPDCVPMTVSIEETIQAATQASNPAASEPPPLLPELQHLSSPPPPPPPPAVFLPNHAHTNSASSGSGVGVINIGIEGQPRGGTPIVDVPSPLTKCEPAPATQSSPSHRRGRSGNENFSSKIKSITERMRSTSRGRNNAKSPPIEQSETPSPYESVPPLYF
ncbi:MAG: hypothetical protein M1830_007880 [Pleopsidium flavum]|nr:MAG: hypothetical protein M1830_007880 [Pleopsidium flavum]